MLIDFDLSNPDGSPRKLIVKRWPNGLRWVSTSDSKEGLVRAYVDFVNNL